MWDLFLNTDRNSHLPFSPHSWIIILVKLIRWLSLRLLLWWLLSDRASFGSIRDVTIVRRSFGVAVLMGFALKVALIMFAAVVHSLSCVRLFATQWTAHSRLPWPSPSPELAQTHVHWVSGAIQPSHPLSPSSPFCFSLSQHQGVFQWVGSSHQVAQVLELQLHNQFFQWIFRVDFL